VRSYLLKSQFNLAELDARIRRLLNPPSTSSPKDAASVARSTKDAAPVATSRKANTSYVPSESLAGDPSRLAELKPIVRRADVQELLDGYGEFKGLSPTVSQILQMLRQSQCSIEAVARAIQQDPGVSMKILKLANSA